MPSPARVRGGGAGALLLGAALTLAAARCNNDAAAPPTADPVSGSLDGELSAITVFGAGASSALYYLRVGGRSTPVRLTFDADPNLASGIALRVWGAPDGEGDGGAFHVLRYEEIITAGADGTTRSALIGQPSQSPTVAWVQMDVNGGGVNQTAAAGHPAHLRHQRAGPLFGTKATDKSVVQYYDENSYGMVKLIGPGRGADPVLRHRLQQLRSAGAGRRLAGHGDGPDLRPLLPLLGQRAELRPGLGRAGHAGTSRASTSG